MQFTNLVLAAAAFVGSANAVLNLTDVTFAGITVGKPFNITYGDAKGPVTLTLQNGNPPNDLKDVEVIASGLPSPSGSYTWTPESSLPANNYNIKVSDGTTTNYGVQFQLLGATASASSSTGTSTGNSTTSTSSSTSTVTSSSNSTTTTGSSTASSTGSSTGSKTSSTGSKTSSTTSATATPSNTNNGAAIASPLALVFLAFAAILSLN